MSITDEDLDAIEARANEPATIGHYDPPPCQHEERGHAPACRRCEIEAIARRGPTFATHGRHDVLVLVAEIRRLRLMQVVIDALPKCESYVGEGKAFVNCTKVALYTDYDARYICDDCRCKDDTRLPYADAVEAWLKAREHSATSQDGV